MIQTKVEGKETIATTEENNTRKEVDPPLEMKLFPMSINLAMKFIPLMIQGGPLRKEKVTTKPNHDHLLQTIMRQIFRRTKQTWTNSKVEALKDLATETETKMARKYLIKNRGRG